MTKNRPVHYMMKKKVFFIFTFGLLIGIVFTFYMQRVIFIKYNHQTNLTDRISPSPEPPNPLTVIGWVDIEGKKAEYEVYKDGIDFYPFENTQTFEAGINITKKDYPKLFEQGEANWSSIIIEEYKDPKSGRSYIHISNVQPDHGGIGYTYSLLVNPHTGEIKEQNPLPYYQ